MYVCVYVCMCMYVSGRTLRAANVLLRKHEEIISGMLNSGEVLSKLCMYVCMYVNILTLTYIHTYIYTYVP